MNVNEKIVSFEIGKIQKKDSAAREEIFLESRAADLTGQVSCHGKHERSLQMLRSLEKHTCTVKRETTNLFFR